MTQETQPLDLAEIARQTKYPLQAFLFVRRGLDETVRQIHGQPAAQDEPAQRHISGQALCHGLKQYASEQYGLLARTVLARWNVTRTEDFGRIVFAMVDAGILQKTAEDSLKDFDSVFDFRQAFATQLKLASSKTSDSSTSA